MHSESGDNDDDEILKFADDTKIYQTVTSAEEVSTLQSDFRNLVAWSTEWQLANAF